MKIDEDIKLMLRVKEDDLQAFDTLYQKYASVVGNFYMRLGCQQETSQDYVQEVFMRIWRARYNYRPLAKFTTYLFQIAKNYWINQREKQKRRPQVHSIESNSHIQQQEENTPLPDVKMLTDELSHKILESIQQLGDKYRLVFVMSEFEGLKYREIAEILDIPIGTVKSRMSTAEKKLREKLSKYVEETSHDS
ncbi:RNA polymerase sigma factor [Candidatus Uabimicrobium sp. HlEnr_7]|uniref:RNA polymerase sigma factor n=1 Tax=Candidatus Uabimicrobium helgolandensis TaxID=3095367 RepID=UPI0035570ABB